MATTITDTTLSEPQSGCHRCDKCRKCRDWYFTGTTDTWNWIRKYDNWNKNDWQRWCKNRIWEQFKLRDGSKCVPNKLNPRESCDHRRHPFVPSCSISTIGYVSFTNYDTHFICTHYHDHSAIFGAPTHYVDRPVGYDFSRRLHVLYIVLSSDVCLCEDNQTI